MAEAEREAQAAHMRRMAARAAKPASDGQSPVDHFNERHTVADLLARYGYTRAGQSNDWKSPYQTGGSYATCCFGDYWISLSGSDGAAGLGTATKNGNRHGDAFDLFCHFDHGGEFNQAVKAYAEEAGLSQGVKPKTDGKAKSTGAKPRTSNKMASFDLIEDGRGRIIWCVENAYIILEQNPVWAGVFAYDEFAGLTMLQKPLPGSTVPKLTFRPRPITDCDLTHVLRWFNRNDFPDATRMTVNDAVDAVARENTFSPVQDYLNALVWDDKPRAGNWLSTYGGAAPTPLTGKQGQVWLVSAAARALKPGCKADCALVLEGEQGARKSSAISVLAGDDWFYDGLHDMHSKDASALLRGKWIIELSELSAMRRTETEGVKAFLSRTVERYRPAYGRYEVIEPRRCVFAGTTNRADWLTDDTGGRRFWPVALGKIDLQSLARDRDQIWAEAVALYKAGAKWWLDPEDEAEAASVVALRAVDDPWLADVLNTVADMSEVSTRDVLQRIGIGIERRGKAEEMRVSGILTRNGWVRSGRFTVGENRNATRFVSPTWGSK